MSPASRTITCLTTQWQDSEGSEWGIRLRHSVHGGKLNVKSYIPYPMPGQVGPTEKGEYMRNERTKNSCVIIFSFFLVVV